MSQDTTTPDQDVADEGSAGRRDLLRLGAGGLAAAGLGLATAGSAAAQPRHRRAWKPRRRVPQPTPTTTTPPATPTPTPSSSPTATATGTATASPTQSPTSSPSGSPTSSGAVLDVYVNEGLVPMVDDKLVYMRGFGERLTTMESGAANLELAPHLFLADGRVVQSRAYPLDAPLPPNGRPTPLAKDPSGVRLHLPRRNYWGSWFPRRAIVAESGSRIRIRVHNALTQTHRLTIHGVDGATTGPIAPGTSGMLDIEAPPPGTYVYSDDSRGIVERMLGLSGALVVIPTAEKWRLSVGGPEFERQWLWIVHDIDPEWGRKARAGEDIDPTSDQPRYFTLNGRSGFRSMAMDRRNPAENQRAHEDTLPSGFARDFDVRDLNRSTQLDTVITGQMIRMVNTGCAIHQMHFHGNHVWTVRRNGRDFPRTGGYVDAEGHVVLQQWEDVVELNPLDRKEIFLPIKNAPDAYEPVRAAQNCDWVYPMHCHAEMSQTAGGGLYPGGLVADWVLAAPLP